MDDNHELRAHLIAALMTAEQMDYADAERVVGEYERERICKLCGSKLDDDACVTVWGKVE